MAEANISNSNILVKKNMRNKHIIPRLISNLKEFRRLHGLTQQQLSDELKIEQGQISKWETGEAEVPSWVLKHLIEKWNVSSNWLLTGKGRPDEPVESDPPGPYTGLDKEQRQLADKLIDIIKKADPEIRQHLVDEEVLLRRALKTPMRRVSRKN